MVTTMLYENKSNEMTAVVLEDDLPVNYVPCPEIAALDGDSFLEEARLGFPDAPLYEPDILIGLTIEGAAKQEAQESTLIARVGEEILLYPHRMSPGQQEFFQLELGDEVWFGLYNKEVVLFE